LKVEHLGITGPFQVPFGALTVNQVPRLGSKPIFDWAGRFVIGNIRKLEEVAAVIHKLPIDLRGLTAAAIRRNDPNLGPQPALKAFAKPIRVGAVRINEPAGNDLHFHDINFTLEDYLRVT
jgi:hypothetical protein